MPTDKFLSLLHPRYTHVTMRSVFVLFVSGVLLFGAGCAWTQPIISPQIAEPLGQNFESHPISQFKGFGEIPSVPSPQLKPGTQGSVQIRAPLPSFPPAITVLRVKSGRPDSVQKVSIFQLDSSVRHQLDMS